MIQIYDDDDADATDAMPMMMDATCSNGGEAARAS